MSDTATDSDRQLLTRYTNNRAEDAFAELIRRHLALVYSAALRQVRSPQLAEEVAQSAFTDLARNARRLIGDGDAPSPEGGRDALSPVCLSSWLYTVTRRTAIDVVRREARRQLREQIATEMNTMNATADDWAHVEPLLDEAVSALDETDRAAVLLRYFENKSLREVGQQLGVSDDAAQKRVSRAVERLREFFAKRGVTVGTSGLAVVISANAVQAAPVGLALTISTAAALTGTTLATTATVTATKAIAMTALQKILVTATIAVLAGAGIYEARQASQLREQVEAQTPLTRRNEQLQQERDNAINQLALLTEELTKAKQNNLELLKLRSEISLLKEQKRLEIKQPVQEVDVSVLFKKIMARYRSLTNYHDSGIAVSAGSITNSFKIRLGRPDQYVIEWNQKTLPEFSFHGAVWSVGKGDFFFNAFPDGRTIYRRMRDSYSARTEGMGFSGGATMLIPNMFYGRMPTGNITRASDEIIGQIDCYKLIIALKDRRWTFWVGKQDLFVRKIEELQFSKPVGVSALDEVDDAAITTSLEKMGKSITAESIAWLRQEIGITRSNAEANAASVVVELHDDIVVNEPMSLENFIPDIPEDLRAAE